MIPYDLTETRKHPKLARNWRSTASIARKRGTPVATKLSARNQIEGTITELEIAGVMAHVTVKVGKNLIESVITRRSAEEMKLKVGDRVSAVIKSTEVMLQKG
jgi:molybdopterin-binding protein